MNPLHPKDAYILAEKIEAGKNIFGKNVDVVVSPPFPYLTAAGMALKKIKLGAQDVFWEKEGAYTGEVSAPQLLSLGVSYVIVGHSERRKYSGETDEMINKKAKVALEHGLSVVLCVGEREQGEISPEVRDQLVSALSGIKKQMLKNLMVCYEPIWAISANKNARPDTPDGAFRASLFIRKVITDSYSRKAADLLRILYGGSVRKDNILPFLTEGKMQGVLVGGASLDADEFTEIIKIASRAAKNG